MKNENYLILYNLQFFAKDGPGGEKTEPATAKKLKDARDEGQVAKSKELNNSFGLFTLFLMLKIMIGTLGSQFMELFAGIYNKIPDVVKDSGQGMSIYTADMLFRNVLMLILELVAPFFVAAFIVSALVELVQVKWQISTKPLMPKFSKLNPIKGFKKIISKESLFELLKSLIKIGIIIYIAYKNLADKIGDIYLLYDIPLKQAIVNIGTIAIEVGFYISLVYFLVGLLDFAYQKHKFSEDMKMTKQELKDEYKNTEGNPEIKQKQKAKMREVSQRRMMQDVKTADVVITNPTHLAVALKYDAEQFGAPIVIAKGADYLAQKIKEEAKKNDVEIVENKPLARMIYANVDIGGQIPSELYQAVAEVLAFVYGIKNKK